MTFLNFETSRLVAIFMGTARRDLETRATLDAWVPQSPTPAARNKVSQLHNISFYEVGRLLREMTFISFSKHHTLYQGRAQRKQDKRVKHATGRKQSSTPRPPYTKKAR